MFPSSSNQAQHKGGKASGNKKRPPAAMNNTHINKPIKDPHAHKSHHKRNKHHGLNMHPQGGYDAGTASPPTHEDMYCCDANED